MMLDVWVFWLFFVGGWIWIIAQAVRWWRGRRTQ